jgi:hypothetical protein
MQVFTQFCGKPILARLLLVLAGHRGSLPRAASTRKVALDFARRYDNSARLAGKLL